MFKKPLALLLCLCILLSLVTVTAFADDITADTSWYDNSKSVFTLYDAADLLGFAQLVNSGNTFEGKTVNLANNINLSGIDWVPIGNESNPFMGNFDGGNHTISNIAISNADKFAGLFGYVTASITASASIKNLKIKYATITCTTSTTYAGAVAGLVEHTFVSEVTVENVVINATDMTALIEIGASFGECGCVVVTDSTVNGAKITYSGCGSSYIGGFSGYVYGHSTYWTADGASINSRFTDCSTANITISSSQNNTNSKAARVGGFTAGCTGYNGSHNTYVDCTVTNVDIDCGGDGQMLVGGFMAVNRGMGYDTDCSATGSITSTNTNGSSVFGGFIGQQGGRGRTHTGHTVDVDITASNGYAGGFVGQTVQYLLESDHQNHYQFVDCTASGNVTCTDGIAGGFAGANGCYGGDGHQIWVTYDTCTAKGNVNGATAAGFLGAIENNSADFNREENIGVTLDECTASGKVSGTTTAGLIGSIDNKNSKSDTSYTTPVTIEDSTTNMTNVKNSYNATSDEFDASSVTDKSEYEEYKENNTENYAALLAIVTISGADDTLVLMPEKDTAAFDTALGTYKLQLMAGDTGFSDVAKTDWFYSDVTSLATKGVVSGYPDGTFLPYGEVTWGEALKLVLKASGFGDIAATGDHWASGYMDKAIELGYISGAVDLNAAITRGEMADLCAAAMKLGSATIASPFADDAPASAVALYEAGIIKGSADNGQLLYRADSTITRAEISAIIWRMVKAR